MRITKKYGRVAVITLLTSLFLGALATSTAFAESPHVVSTADTDRCSACHSTHTSTNSGDTSGACVTCHSGADGSATNVIGGDADSFGMASGHSLAPKGAGTAQITGCATCHDVHLASSVERGIPTRTINGVAVSSAGKQLCIACHASSTAWFGPEYPSTSSPTRDATGFPIAGTWPGPETYLSASNPHRLIPESTQTVGVSDPVRREQGDCQYCHGAHGGRNAYDSLVTTYTVPNASTLASDKAQGSYAALCFTCHGGDTPSGFTTAPVDIKQFATASDATSGHSIVTSGGTLPVGAPLPCFECHAPMGSARGNASALSDERGASLQTSTDAGVRAFCFTCHTTSDTTAGWDSATAAFVPVSPAEKIVGLPRDGAQLHLSATDGHAQGDARSCYACHGNDYGAGGNNVHNPNDGSALGKALALSLNILASNTATLSLDATSSVSPSTSVDATQSVIATSTVATPDTTAPVTISDVRTSYVGTATITLTATDASGGSGVAETYYQLDGGPTVTGTVVSVSAVGAHTLTFWSADNAGNVEAVNTVTFTITADPGTVAAAPSIQPALAARNDWWTGSIGT